MSIGAKVKALRIQNDITQEELAKKIGVTSGTIGMIETDNRKPSLDVLKKIATVFNVSTDYLLDIKPIDNATDLELIQRARNKMTSEQKEKMMNLLKISFEELFDEEKDD